MHYCGVGPVRGLLQLAMLEEVRVPEPPVQLSAIFFEPGSAVQVAAERRRPARDDGVCGLLLSFCQGVALAIGIEVAAKDVRHLECGTYHRHTQRASGMR